MTLEEFQNITLIKNVPSILRHGIVSYVEAAKLPHGSVALQAVQDKRDAKRVPGGLALHEYANVYFHARNPMMYRRQEEAARLCVLRVSTEILKIPGAVITDQNAASNYVRFSAPDRLKFMNRDYIFARNWKHPENQIDEWRHSSAKCAEALIPGRIPADLLLGAYVVDHSAKEHLEACGFQLPITIDADLHFHHHMIRSDTVRPLIGDMFASKMQTLVNTVNCVGVMGKGIAQIFKKEYRQMLADDEARCERGEVQLGEPYHYKDLAGVSIVNFPTKGHWRAATRLADVEAGLDYFVNHFRDWGITSAAFPPLGCGNGGLEWSAIGPLMYYKLAQIGIPVEIYAPFGTPAVQVKPEFLGADQQTEFLVKGKRREKMRAEWAALVEVIYELQKQPYANPVGRTIFQKICYILTKQGVDTGFRFERSSYGPFAPEVKEAIGVLANRNWIIEEQLGKMTALRAGPEYQRERDKMQDELEPFRRKIDKTVDLFSRIKNTGQAEEVATVIYAVQVLKKKRDPGEVSEQDLFDYILDWKKLWRKDEGKQGSVAEAIRNLEMLGWVKLRFSESLPVPA